jgi:hypothetical protein
MGSEWILGRLAWGCGLDSTDSGQGPVAGCCECDDEPSGSGATELVSLVLLTNEALELIISKCYTEIIISKSNILYEPFYIYFVQTQR